MEESRYRESDADKIRAIIRANGQDPDDHHARLEAFIPYGVRTASARVDDVHTAEDLAHDAALKVLHARRLDGDLGVALGCYLRSVHNLVNDMFRKPKCTHLQPSSPTDTDDGTEALLVDLKPTPAQVAEGLERDAQLRSCLDQLPDREREVLQMHFFEGLQYTEISDLLSVNLNTVRSWAKKARERLRLLLEPRHAQPS